MMNIDEIKQATQKLTAIYAAMCDTEKLQDSVAIAWGKQILVHLTYTLTQHADNTPELFRALKILLKDNHSRTQGTLLSYTARPDSDITKLLTSVAVYVAENTEEPADQQAIELLMPTLSLQSLNPNYAHLNSKDLNAVANIKTLLQTHILGQGGRYLLPVGLLAELSLDPEAVKLWNPYFDYSAHSVDACFVRAEELMRLITHSPLTQAVWDKKQAYDALTSDNSNLLGLLSQLCRQLGINSKDGFGQELHAASGVYPAIIAFTECFDELDLAVKATIPAPLMTEIQTLREVGDIKNTVAMLDTKGKPMLDVKGKPMTEINIQTCIASRRTGLITAMSGHDELLSSISLSGDNKILLTRKARAEFELAKEELIVAIKKNAYQDGRDALGISVPLLRALAVDFHVLSEADLLAIRSLSPSEITEVCESKALRKQVITQLRTLGNLVIFAMETPPERLNAFLMVMADNIAEKWIHSPRDLSALLISLDVEKCDVVCDSMPASLSAIIKTPDDFYEVLEELSPEQRTSVYKTRQASLPDMIKSPADLFLVVNLLTQEQKESVVDIIIHKLPGIIKTSGDFYNVVQELTAAQRTIACDLMMPSLPVIIRSVSDFHGVRGCLAPAQRTIACDLMMPSLPLIIRSVPDFLSVRGYFTPAQRIIACKTMMASQPKFIKSVAEFVKVLEPLTPEEHIIMFESMMSLQPAIIKSLDDFSTVLLHLPAQKCQIFHDSIEAHWLKIVEEKDPRFGAVKRFVEIDTTCSATLLKLAQYKDYKSLSPENKVMTNRVIQALTQARNSLREKHLAFIQNHVTIHDMTAAEDTCCNDIARILEGGMLPIRRELVQAILPLAKLSKSLSEITKQFCIVDLAASKTTANYKAVLKEIRAKGAHQKPGNDDETPTTPRV